MQPEGVKAFTKTRKLKDNGEFSLLEVELLTGRTHQIRVHLAHAGHPIVGDDKYGDFALNRELKQRLLLHAARLAFRHPVTGESMKLESPLPAEMKAFVESRLQVSYRLLVFDWDGTIIDSASAIVDCICAAARDTGIPVPPRERAAHTIGLGLHDALRFAVPDLPAERYADFVAHYRKHFLACQDSMQLFDGMRELLSELSRDPRARHRHRQKPPRPGPRARGRRPQGLLHRVALCRRDQSEAAPGDAARADG